MKQKGQHHLNATERLEKRVNWRMTTQEMKTWCKFKVILWKIKLAIEEKGRR